MTPSPASAPRVAVTGVCGYVGSHIAACLLRAGYVVHGTVRKRDAQMLAHLTSLEVAGRLEVFEAELTTPGSYDRAVAGCMYAIHAGSPYVLNADDPQNDLLAPAVDGTLSFLRSCEKANVRKVVLTSSVAAIADGGTHGEALDESVWNSHSSVRFLPYYHAKTVAEKAAWAFVERENVQIKLVVINPVAALGPSLTGRMNQSFTLLRSTVQGLFQGIIDLKFPVVDVRDVAEAHVRAMENEQAEGRYICAADTLLAHREIAEIAIQFGFHPPMRSLENRLSTTMIKSMSHVMPGGSEGQYTRRHLGNPLIVTNEKIKRDLGIQFRDVHTTVKESFQNFIENGLLEKPQASCTDDV